MKKSVFIIFFFSSVLSMSARPNDVGDDARLNKSYKYEGSVSLTYSYEVAVGLSTVHGVRLGGDRWFVGGALSADIGFPYGSFYSIGFHPRWFFVNAEKVECYLGCDVGFEYLSGWNFRSDADKSASYGIGPELDPELGMGIRLRNGDAIDIAVSCSIDFMLSGTYYYRDGDFGGPLPLTLIRPGISVGYRF